VPRIFGEKIMLREYSDEDLMHMREWVNDPEIIDNLSDIFLPPQTWHDTERFLQLAIEGKLETKYHFVIANKDTQTYIGQIDLISVDWKNRSTEMGIVIGKKAFLGKGIGTEAIKLLQYFVFDRLNLNRLQLSLHEYNQRAYHCYLKCGFVEEGRFRQNFYINGQYTDHIYMAILRDEYYARTDNYTPKVTARHD